MNQQDLLSNNVIFQTKSIDSKIYVKEQKGFYQRIRRVLGWALILLFIITPFVQYNNEQAILFNVAAQKLNLFSVVLYPQDLMFFALLFLFSAFTLFYISTKYGRIWCGYVCPQTIWSMWFLWIEQRTEGNRQQRIQLDKQPYSIKKVLIKTQKHFYWLVISVFTATIFMSYFIPAREIYLQLATLQLSSLEISWISFFAVCTYINAGWIREKMCEHMCPYSRFQSVMFTANTKLISYDQQRGEGRGARKVNASKPDDLGDCVDCNLCVQVCPVGIDIRDGLQYECISCGLCIDACDQTMKKFSYEKGLISYRSENTKPNKKSVNFLYIVLLLGIFIAFFYWIENHRAFEVFVLKDRNVLYRIVDNDIIENSFQIKLFNKSKDQVEFEVNLVGLENFTINNNNVINVGAEKSEMINIKVYSSPGYSEAYTKFNFVFKQKGEEFSMKKASVFHAR